MKEMNVSTHDWLPGSITYLFMVYAFLPFQAPNSLNITNHSRKTSVLNPTHKCIWAFNHPLFSTLAQTKRDIFSAQAFVTEHDMIYELEIQLKSSFSEVAAIPILNIHFSSWMANRSPYFHVLNQWHFGSASPYIRGISSICICEH